ncbi:hypothetical protein PTSG_04446 [Salpingoeca rosetta]|uniref:Aminotransferase class I/classII large domain-containing protein n=1 Tax=Salpingoeca rosetta (strain ATCC 50818 / BSB-021) TaxID=946362 RepID=F2U8L0_SALR5|nr:uncharacterized protein PTSG_04446 [Salpingoeca rosetta]EGD72718.1 hypothetical protein PTSG_04446 [Salpingoeca rosetta]|eukprot:XP_004994541.1 hypothetical protein PTSG_04446 [Salpingoeca rosetta]
MVTAGANQAFANIVLALCDAGDEVVLFRPYYFNHHMALQMTGCNISYCPRDHTTFAPDLDWLEANLAGKKMLVLVNPCNPTGTVASKEELKAMSKLCTQHGVWFIVDNTYEYFVFDGAHHESIGGDHVLNVYSFSKAYGLMGWRVGYIAWQNDALTPQLMKVQDTVVICPARLSQVVALGAVAAGHEWCAERIRKLDTNREILFDAIRSYDPNALVGRHDGAIYAMVKVPHEEDERVAEWLAHQHHVAVIPGSSCGLPGFVRVAFANLSPAKCKEASARLCAGLRELKANEGDALLV